MNRKKRLALFLFALAFGGISHLHAPDFSANFGAPNPLVNSHAFPVPFMPSRGDTTITFTDLTNTATIKIFTASGQLVATLQETDGDGRYVWDSKSSAGENLASGVYIYEITSPSDSKEGKLVIVR